MVILAYPSTVLSLSARRGRRRVCVVQSRSAISSVTLRAFSDRQSRRQRNPARNNANFDRLLLHLSVVAHRLLRWQFRSIDYYYYLLLLLSMMMTWASVPAASAAAICFWRKSDLLTNVASEGKRKEGLYLLWRLALSVPKEAVALLYVFLLQTSVDLASRVGSAVLLGFGLFRLFPAKPTHEQNAGDNSGEWRKESTRPMGAVLTYIWQNALASSRSNCF